MKKPKKLPAEEKYDRLNDLLYQFGMNNIDHATFWGQMNQHGYGQDDIDEWCTLYYAREKEKEDGLRKTKRT